MNEQWSNPAGEVSFSPDNLSLDKCHDGHMSLICIDMCCYTSYDIGFTKRDHNI